MTIIYAEDFLVGFIKFLKNAVLKFNLDNFEGFIPFIGQFNL